MLLPLHGVEQPVEAQLAVPVCSSMSTVGAAKGLVIVESLPHADGPFSHRTVSSTNSPSAAVDSRATTAPSSPFTCRKASGLREGIDDSSDTPSGPPT